MQRNRNSKSVLARIRSSRGFRYAASLTALTFLYQMVEPTVANALTGGPSQPEVGGFQQVGSTNMVDPFTGNFSYNIPLLTVPGPNGGYPINLGYQSGISMEQEASWVGLGWSLTPGAITRNVRGLPDDFNGDVVTKEVSIRPSTTVSFDLNNSSFETQTQEDDTTERFGFDFSLVPVINQTTQTSTSKRSQLYFDSYTGLGFRFSASPSKLVAEKGEDIHTGLGFNPTISFDSNKGIGFSPSISLKSQILKQYSGFTFTPVYNSRQGLQDVQMSTNVNLRRYFYETGGLNVGAGVSFARTTSVPNVNLPRFTQSVTVSAEIGNFSSETVGPTSWVFENTQQVIASITTSGISEENQLIPAYGYMHAEDRPSDAGNTMSDFERSKNININRRSPNLPIPINTYDSYNITGQGMSGAFRPFRSDIGILSDNTQRSDGGGGALGFEISDNSSTAPASGAVDNKIGIDFTSSISSSYSGPWSYNDDALTNPSTGIRHKGKDESTPQFEPFYFKTMGEMTALPTDELSDIGGTNPVAFDIVMGENSNEDLTFSPKITKKLLNSPNYNISRNQRTTRQKRVQDVRYRTIAEVKGDPQYVARPLIYGESSTALYPFKVLGGGDALVYPNEIDHHVGEMSVVQSDGSRYTYGLPVFNHRQDEVVFALGESNVPNNKYENPRRVGYNLNDATPENDNGEDHYYSRTSLPAYAHSYLLTAVTSTNYVDLTGDGPSEDDLGYYSKFNYTKLHDDYEWRHPYSGANYSKGRYSYEEDDKGSYSYGKKEIYFLNSVETKTHIAIFVLQDREDAMDADGEDKLSPSQILAPTGNKLKCLKEIRLYAKNDVTTVDATTGIPDVEPIKTVHFEYDYSLCPNVENNSGVPVSTLSGNLNDAKGKLTLKKVFFTYLNSSKGSLSPYEFQYNGLNPPYDYQKADRWGNFRKDDQANDGYLNNQENPYSTQVEDYNRDGTINGADELARKQEASAWNLTDIILPSGGMMKVEYEPDDYAFVQDRQAMQMLRILGVGKNLDDPNNGPEDLSVAKLTKNRLRVFFEMDKEAGSSQDVVDYVENIGAKNLFFKVWMRLKDEPDILPLGQEEAYGYVSGYAGIDFSQDIGFLQSDRRVGYFSLIADSHNGGVSKVHPFKKAGWQAIQLTRPDLFQAQNQMTGSVISLIQETLGLITESVNFIFGFYNGASIRGFANKIDLDAKPSYIRLNVTDGVKYGGGCRVRKITINDNWIEGGQSGHEYGTVYEYTTTDEDGNTISSGVAEYEPLTGGEEIPHHQPIWYNGNDQFINVRHIDAFMEEPLGEAFYPSPNVGYSRVVMSSIQNANVTESATGVTVQEFYTAKDFPTICKRTSIDHVEDITLVPIPFIGTQWRTINGYSQGYVVELNDMHGKPKRTSVYRAQDNFEANTHAFFAEQPVSKTEYIYQTSANDSKQLDNEVTVLTEDGNYSQALIGLTYDFFTDMHEDYTESKSSGLAPNLETHEEAATVIIIPSLIPKRETSKSMMRSMVTNKVIYRNGILKEVRAFSDGAYITTRNLMWDAQTGQSLLSVVDNEHRQPVYSYSFAGHWAYEGMQPSYQNIRTVLRIQHTTNGVCTLAVPSAGTNVSEFLTAGDELVYQDSQTGENVTLFVEDVDEIADDFTVRLEDNSFPSSGLYSVTVMNSGYRNQQSVGNGGIVALKNPVTERTFPLFEALSANPQGGILDITNCDGTVSSVNVSAFSGEDGINFTKGGGNDDCGASLTFPQAIPGGVFNGLVNLERFGSRVVATYSNGDTYEGTWVDPEGCYDQCLDGVLHASAVELREQGWDYNYLDVGNPMIDPDKDDNFVTMQDAINNPLASEQGNAYRYGARGIWRVDRTNLYQVDRKQFADPVDFKTKIDEDGTFDYFTFFNWLTVSDNKGTVENTETNNEWIWTEKINRYSPYGFGLASENAINVHSAQLYGYNNSVVTAVAANAEYMEIGYDGFEDYPDADANGSFTNDYADHGHFRFRDGNNNTPALTDEAQHTGDYAMVLATGGTLTHEVDYSISEPDFFTPQLDGIADNPDPNEYVVSGWAYVEGGDRNMLIDIEQENGSGTVSLIGGSLDLSTTNEPVIEGWKRFEVRFKLNDVATPANGELFRIRFTDDGNNGAEIYLDDLRVHPHKGSMMTYAYDQEKLWLLSTHDNRNFSTVNTYDEEGALVQTKQETYRGFITTMTARSNVKQDEQQ